MPPDQDDSSDHAKTTAPDVSGIAAPADTDSDTQVQHKATGPSSGMIASGKGLVGSILRDPAVTSLVTAFVAGQASKTLKKSDKKNGIMTSIMGFAVTKVATRSMPGALAVGAGLLAKTLYDRKKAKQRAEDEDQVAEKQIEDKSAASDA